MSASASTIRAPGCRCLAAFLASALLHAYSGKQPTPITLRLDVAPHMLYLQPRFCSHTRTLDAFTDHVQIQSPVRYPPSAFSHLCLRVVADV